ncbi:ATP-binding cassette domain-containing protein [Kineosporia sp. J2-2]|uniref:ATP-binding cassette domain-containing protein n=1 Tax=Kineosporia corallincola TaxID=2835133 RepID=A0ABS5TF13_9ACTN|nr:ATP-binding cassette domain-containing protein [Kineosporia corallincola]MBT0768806.1 ATP-binding cassette domain-containing protein [Kineosporia corallincola]
MTDQQLAVSVRGVSHRFGDHVAVDDLSLDIAAGETFGLLGPNGAGKTTTIRMLTTLLPLRSGSVRIFGVDPVTRPMVVRRAIGYVPQQLSVEGALTGRENVAWFARLFDVPRKQRSQRVDDALAMLDLTEAADRLAGTYSGGMVRRLELAQALVNRPALLILDEPTVGLDPVARDSVWQRVRRMQAEYGMTVLLTTHYMEEAEQLCHRVALMHRGRLQADGTPAELQRQLGPEATLEDVFRHHTGGSLTGDEQEGGLRDVRSARRTARRLG